MKAQTQILLLAAALLLLGLVPLSEQSMIDLTKEEVRALVKENHKEFRRDRSVVNQRFNDLKYGKGGRTLTWILYFTEEYMWRGTKLICEYGEYDELLEELNLGYDKVGDSEWQYKLQRDTIQVVLTREEWYFTVREARKK